MEPVKSVLLSTSLGLSVAEAERIAASLGISGVRFVSCRTSRRAVATVGIAPARSRDPRGARFLAREQRGLTRSHSVLDTH